jgi:phage shock protein E
MKRSLLISLLALAGCSKSEPVATPVPGPGSAAPSAVAATSPTGSPSKATKDPAAARKLIAEGAVVVDVRTAEEFEGGNLPTATNLPIDQFPQAIAQIDTLVSGDKSKPVVVYCATGGRAAKAKQALDAAGYTNVVNGGGYDDLE